MKNDACKLQNFSHCINVRLFNPLNVPHASENKNNFQGMHLTLHNEQQLLCKKIYFVFCKAVF